MSEKCQPPSGPPPSYSRATSAAPDRSTPTRELASNNPFRNAHLDISQGQRPSSTASSIYEPPPGPPPTWGGDVEMSESGASSPRGSSARQTPRAHTPQTTQQYEPPPGPPPPSRLGTESVPPPYDPWHGDGDTLRPPPSFSAAHPSNTKSPTANASFEDAKRGHEWCRANGLWKAVQYDSYFVERIQAGDLRLTVPPNTTDITIYQPAIGRTYIRTAPSLTDTILLSDVPIYASHHQSPLSTGHPQSVYFELRIMNIGDRYNRNNTVESGIAIGFVAPPYPAWRLPGWHRGSLGVHGDDGRRYVNNSFGGQDFTAAFKKDDVVGIGIKYEPPRHGDRISMRAQVFFTRNGKSEGGWDLHEERDKDVEEGEITGLEGEHDILAAVGIFGAIEVETRFRAEEWMYKP